jgi:hypothetical protein
MITQEDVGGLTHDPMNVIKRAKYVETPEADYDIGSSSDSTTRRPRTLAKESRRGPCES